MSFDTPGQQIALLIFAFDTGKVADMDDNQIAVAQRRLRHRPQTRRVYPLAAAGDGIGNGAVVAADKGSTAQAESARPGGTGPCRRRRHRRSAPCATRAAAAPAPCVPAKHPRPRPSRPRPAWHKHWRPGLSLRQSRRHQRRLPFRPHPRQVRQVGPGHIRQGQMVGNDDQDLRAAGRQARRGAGKGPLSGCPTETPARAENAQPQQPFDGSARPLTRRTGPSPGARRSPALRPVCTGLCRPPARSRGGRRRRRRRLSRPP